MFILSSCSKNVPIQDKKEGVKPDILHREHTRSLFSLCTIGNIVYSTGQDRVVAVYNLSARYRWNKTINTRNTEKLNKKTLKVLHIFSYLGSS